MLVPAPPTAFSRLSPRPARGVLLFFLTVIAFCIGLTISPLKSDHRYHDIPGEGDLALYRAEAARVRAGESYYSAAGTELRARGYPTRNVFNWRTPLPVVLFGKLPGPLAPLILALASMAVLLLGLKLIEREDGVFAVLIGIPLLFGALSACWMEPLYYLTELWAGVFIALSLCCYATNRSAMGVVAGLSALFLRELSLLYVLISLGFALARRRWTEAAAWISGLALYAVFLGFHIHSVSQLIRPDDFAQPEGWVRFGGTAFIIGTAHLNALILLQPQWVAAVYFGLAMLGFAGWNNTVGQRFALVVSTYVITFSVIGLYYNQYWGAMYAPLLCFGAARAPASLRDLWKACQWQAQPKLAPEIAP